MKRVQLMQRSELVALGEVTAHRGIGRERQELELNSQPARRQRHQPGRRGPVGQLAAGHLAQRLRELRL